MKTLTKFKNIKFVNIFFNQKKKLSKNQCLKIKALKSSNSKNIKSLISVFVIFLNPNSKNLLKIKKSIKISYDKLKKLQKFGLFLYIIITIYRGIFFNPLFFFGILLPPFYLFLLQQHRVKGFIRMRQRDTRVRLEHYYNDFYYLWVFVNASFIFLAICGLIMYYFELIENYLSTMDVLCPISLDQFKQYTFYYCLLVIGVNWLTNMYIIWYKNTKTFLKFLASQEVTIGAGLTSYFSLQGFVNLSTPEVNPRIHYYYHSYDPFGRGYHFHTARHIEQSNWVKGALGDRYNPKMFLDDKNYLDRPSFLGFVWANRFEIGGELSDSQKEEFPSWIKWAPDTELNAQTVIKDSNGVVIGRMGYDSQKRIVPQFKSGVELEPFYRPANYTGPSSFDKEYTITGSTLDSVNDKEECVPIISPVASQESSTSSITSVGEIIVPGSNTRTK